MLPNTVSDSRQWDRCPTWTLYVKGTTQTCENMRRHSIKNKTHPNETPSLNNKDAYSLALLTKR